jgi:2-polyprenyl-6-methoxyphenol hydroxylase-like FAD-dependent oxidoreductase
MNQSSQDGVLVVGAGPVGLTMACELRRHGANCRIIDAEAGPTPPEQSRAIGMHARTLEVFDAMGIAAPLVDRGRRVRALNAYQGGRHFARLDLDFSGLDTLFPFVLSLSQGETEQVLVDHLSRLGGSVEWRTQLDELKQDASGVEARLRTEAGDQNEIRVGWLIGCDGAHSVVRHQLGLPFEGASYDERFLLADVRMALPLADDEGHLLLTPEDLLAVFPLPGSKRWRLIDATGETYNDDDPLAIPDRFQKLLHKAGLSDAEIEEVEWVSSFHISRRAADRLRVGRCFLAGDAAHIHSPVGGQGMNTGIQDAHDLAWKLALVIEGAAPKSLLDSYQAERHAVAESVLRDTDRATWVATLKNPFGRGIRNLLVRLLSRSTSVRRHLTRDLSELGVSYRGSPAVSEDWPGHSPAEVPRAGDRVPDIELDGAPGRANRLHELLHGTRYTLLEFEAKDGANHNGHAAAESLPERWADHIDAYRVLRPGADTASTKSPSARAIFDPDGRLHERFDARDDCLYLIRPDGYVGYRAHPPDPGRLAAYMERVLI